MRCYSNKSSVSSQYVRCERWKFRAKCHVIITSMCNARKKNWEIEYVYCNTEKREEEASSILKMWCIRRNGTKHTEKYGKMILLLSNGIFFVRIFSRVCFMLDKNVPLFFPDNLHNVFTWCFWLRFVSASKWSETQLETERTR